VKGKLVCVFGAGGDRDKEKRPFMGKVASGLADLTIVTDDNPRSESPSAIREEIMKGCPSAQNVGGRSEAIRLGLSKLSGGDLLVIAGKGHETGQEIGGATIPFNDAAFVSAQLNDVVGETP
jgi:UDP-N-acetylmuramoyl-L-alanyl-D-glutamate--2,6-diaminopimelate ligase